MLIATICIVFLAGYLISAWQRRDQTSLDDKLIQAIAQQEYEEFIASLEEKEQSGEKQYTSYKPKKVESIPVILASLYGMTEDQYSVLSPYIHIPPEDTVRHTPQLYITETVPVENIKYKTGTILDLNRADTTELKKVPGIGSGIARLIVGYRQRLGGFYQIEQLKDINLDTQQLQAWFSIDLTNVHRINLNHTGIDRLRSHPYINFYQAKAIVEYRKKKGSLTSLKPFSLYEEFTKADLERISHYVCFE